MAIFGLTPQGFQAMQQQDIIADLESAWQAQFGANVALGPETVNGQIISIMAERLALGGWQLAEAVYQSQFPQGAEGTSVDNILALINKKRGAARATVTNPVPVVQNNQETLYGLVLYGTPGTLVPAKSQISNGASPPVVFKTDADITIGSPVNCVQTLVMSNSPTQGSYSLTFTDAAQTLITTAAFSYATMAQSTLLNWTTAPTKGAFTLTLAASASSSMTSSVLAYNVTAAQMQTAITNLSGYSTVTVSGSVAAGFVITWGTGLNPLVTVTNSGMDYTPNVINSLQARVNSLTDASTGNQPFSDVAVSQVGNSYRFAFGAFSPLSGQPSSAAQPQPIITIASTSLQSGTSVTNLSIVETVSGAPAQGVGTATCTQTGPNSVTAGTLTTIVNPISGWSGVINQLDCIVGAATQDDTAALTQRLTELSANASGPLPAIVQKMLDVEGVTAAIGFANLGNAAQQLIQFGSVPTQGTWALYLNGQTTSAIAAVPLAGQVQTALAALTGYSTVLVTGNPTYGFTVDFNGASGGQAQPMLMVVNNTTSVPITVSYARPPKSVEMVVQGGTNSAVAQALYNSMPAGIATYAAPVLQTTGTIFAGSNSLTVLSTVGLSVGLTVSMSGLTPGTSITSIQGATLTLSQPAIGNASNATVTFTNATQISDIYGNPFLIGFSRPVQIPIFVSVQLLTDQYNTPGVSSSGVNAQAKFNPQTIAQIQNDIVAAGSTVGIGGLIVAMGTNSLVGSFGEVPGVVSYSLAFGTSQNPNTLQNLQMLPEQEPYFTAYNVAVSYL